MVAAHAHACRASFPFRHSPAAVVIGFAVSVSLPPSAYRSDTATAIIMTDPAPSLLLERRDGDDPLPSGLDASHIFPSAQALRGAEPHFDHKNLSAFFRCFAQKCQPSLQVLLAGYRFSLGPQNTIHQSRPPMDKANVKHKFCTVRNISHTHPGGHSSNIDTGVLCFWVLLFFLSPQSMIRFTAREHFTLQDIRVCIGRL